MPTDNPKVSGYVPQHIYDRFKIFSQERGISMSQAVTVIFAEYFGLDLQVDHKNSTGSLLIERFGVLEERFGVLEQEVASLKLLSESRLPNVDTSLTQMLDRALVVQSGNLPSGTPISDKAEESSINVDLIPEAELPSEPLSPEKIHDAEESVEEVVSEVKVDSPVYNLLGEPLDEIKPIPGVKLSEFRFGFSRSMIAGRKREKPIEEFTKWTKDSDPDRIAWKYVETPSKGYIPVDELSSEQRSKLLGWMRENGLL